MASLDERRRAYICFRPIFEEQHGECREKGQIRKLIKSHAALQELRGKIGYAKLQGILRQQVSDGLFDSELRAWQDFPDLAPPDSDFPRLAQQVADETHGDRDDPAGVVPVPVPVPVVDDELELAEIMSASSGDYEEPGAEGAEAVVVAPGQATHEEGMALLSVGAGTSGTGPMGMEPGLVDARRRT